MDEADDEGWYVIWIFFFFFLLSVDFVEKELNWMGMDMDTILLCILFFQNALSDRNGTYLLLPCHSHFEKSHSDFYISKFQIQKRKKKIKNFHLFHISMTNLQSVAFYSAIAIVCSFGSRLVSIPIHEFLFTLTKRNRIKANWNWHNLVFFMPFRCNSIFWLRFFWLKQIRYRCYCIFSQSNRFLRFRIIKSRSLRVRNSFNSLFTISWKWNCVSWISWNCDFSNQERKTTFGPSTTWLWSSDRLTTSNLNFFKIHPLPHRIEEKKFLFDTLCGRMPKMRELATNRCNGQCFTVPNVVQGICSVFFRHFEATKRKLKNKTCKWTIFGSFKSFIYAWNGPF